MHGFRFAGTGTDRLDQDLLGTVGQAAFRGRAGGVAVLSGLQGLADVPCGRKRQGGHHLYAAGTAGAGRHARQGQSHRCRVAERASRLRLCRQCGAAGGQGRLRQGRSRLCPCPAEVAAGQRPAGRIVAGGRPPASGDRAARRKAVRCGIGRAGTGTSGQLRYAVPGPEGRCAGGAWRCVR
ncbi:hypothetical protein D3C85_1361540 [compost metagenome]